MLPLWRDESASDSYVALIITNFVRIMVTIAVYFLFLNLFFNFKKIGKLIFPCKGQAMKRPNAKKLLNTPIQHKTFKALPKLWESIVFSSKIPSLIKIAS